MVQVNLNRCYMYIIWYLLSIFYYMSNKIFNISMKISWEDFIQIINLLLINLFLSHIKGQTKPFYALYEDFFSGLILAHLLFCAYFDQSNHARSNSIGNVISIMMLYFIGEMGSIRNLLPVIIYSCYNWTLTLFFLQKKYVNPRVNFLNNIITN